MVLYCILVKLCVGKKRLFWFCEGLVPRPRDVGQNQMCRLCGCLKEILKNAKGRLFLFFLSLGLIAQQGQLESLAAWSIWSVF